jgi:hypothetical protein
MQGRKISKLIIVMAFNCRLGKCMSLKECYPYFKIFELPLRDTWVMGLYDTCSYQSPEGRQVSSKCSSAMLRIRNFLVGYRSGSLGPDPDSDPYLNKNTLSTFFFKAIKSSGSATLLFS